MSVENSDPIKIMRASLLLVEQIWIGIVSTYLNLNYLLAIVIIAGILDVFSEHLPKLKEKIVKMDYIYILVLGIVGFMIIKFKTISLGWLSWLVSVIAGILIILLSLLVLEDEDKENEENEENDKNQDKKVNGGKHEN